MVRWEWGVQWWWVRNGKAILDASSCNLWQGGMGGMGMMNPMMVHSSPLPASLPWQRTALTQTLFTGHGRHRYDESYDGNGRLCEYIRLATSFNSAAIVPTKHDSQGMLGGGLGSGAYGVGIGSPYTSTWFPSWVQQLIYRAPWYT